MAEWPDARHVLGYSRQSDPVRSAGRESAPSPACVNLQSNQERALRLAGIEIIALQLPLTRRKAQPATAVAAAGSGAEAEEVEDDGQGADGAPDLPRPVSAVKGDGLAAPRARQPFSSVRSDWQRCPPGGS